MDLVKQQQNIDKQVCLKILTDKEYVYASKRINLSDHYFIISSKSQQAGYYRYGVGIGQPLLSFDDIFQSFTDPERPTEEEFVMFKLQHGVDWIVEPKGLNL